MNKRKKLTDFTSTISSNNTPLEEVPSSDLIYARMVSYFHDNLETFMEVNKLSANQLANLLQCSEKTISSYKTTQKVADPKILGGLKTVYDISLDDFLFRRMSREELMREEGSFHKLLYYKGLYIVFYLSTESFKGSESKDSSEALRYGLLYVYESEFHKSNTSLQCVAGLGIEDKQEILNLYDICQHYIKLKNNTSVISSIESYKGIHFYRGQLTIDKDHYYISMSYISESVLMIGYSISDHTNRPYIGGLVTVNSISRGRENAPVLQLAGLSRNWLDCNDEEMEVALQMHYKIELGDEAERILEFVKNPPGYLIKSEELKLRDEQLKAILTADIEYEIRRIIEKRVYRHYKMISSEDSLFYHYLKTRLNGPRGDIYGKGKY